MILHLPDMIHGFSRITISSKGFSKSSTLQCDIQDGGMATFGKNYKLF